MTTERTSRPLLLFARVVQQQRHDVESVASAGANPAASTNFEPPMDTNEHESNAATWAAFNIRVLWCSFAVSTGAEATVDRHRTFNPVW